MTIKKNDYDPTDLEDVKTWTTAPNNKMGDSIKKSVNQSIKDGGVRSVRNSNKGKSIGKEITTNKGNKTYIQEYAKIDNQNKNRNNNKKKKKYLEEYEKLKSK